MPLRRRKTSQRRCPTRTRCGRRPACLASCAPSWQTPQRTQSLSRWVEDGRGLAAGTPRRPHTGSVHAVSPVQMVTNSSRVWQAFCARQPSLRVLCTALPCLQSPDFWVLVAALKRFIEQEGQGQLPLEVGHMRRARCAAPDCSWLPCCLLPQCQVRLVLDRSAYSSSLCWFCLLFAGQHPGYARLHNTVPGAAARVPGARRCRWAQHLAFVGATRTRLWGAS